MTWITDLFDRLGKKAGEIEDMVGWQDDLVSSVATMNGDYTDADRRYMERINGGLSGMLSQIQLGPMDTVRLAAQDLLLETLRDDATEPLASTSMPDQLRVLIAEMDSAGDDVKRSNLAVGSTTYDGDNTGSGKLICSLTQADGTPLQTVRPETLVAQCTADASVGQRTLGQESFVIRGEETLGELDRAWPGGSGIADTLPSVDGYVEAVQGVGGNLLTNGDMQDYTVTNTPDQWAITSGLAGTHWWKATTSCRPGMPQPIVGASENSLKCVGDGSTLSEVRQAFNDSTDGTGGKLRSSTPYVLSLWLRDGSAHPTSGVLKVAVEDSSAVEIDATNGSSVTVTLSTLTSSWSHHYVAFWTPAQIPDGARVSIRLTTAIPLAKSIYIDELVCTEMARFSKGPWWALISGPDSWALGDRIDQAVTRSGSDGKLQLYADRLWGMHQYGLQLPNAASPSIADSVVT